MFEIEDKVKILWKVGKGLPDQKAIGIIVEKKRFGDYMIKIMKTQSTIFRKNEIYRIPKKYILV